MPSCVGGGFFRFVSSLLQSLLSPSSLAHEREQRCALKFCPVAEMDDLKNEIGMQCLSKHPNIVTLREAFVTKTEVRESRKTQRDGEMDAEQRQRQKERAHVCFLF